MNSLKKAALYVTALGGLGLGATAYGDTLVVDQNDPACDDASGTPFCTIQAAIDAALPGDEIQVRAGVYFEMIVIDVPDLTLNGDDEEGHGVIRGNDEGVLVTIAADGVIFEEFEVRRGEIGIMAHGVNNVQLIDNEIHKNTSHGVSMTGTGNMIVNNDIFNNDDDGIRLGSATEATSTGNVITDNDVCENGAIGIHLINADANEVSLTDSEANGTFGICLSNSHDNMVLACELEANPTGLLLIAGSTGNEMTGNEIEESEDYGVLAQGGGGNTYTSNEIVESGLDGVIVLTDGNHFEANKLKENEGNGVVVAGATNTFLENKSVENGQHGFRIESDGNVFTSNTAKKNNRDGYRVVGTGNALMGNKAKLNSKHGFRIDPGADANDLVDNVSKDNGKWGINMHGDAGATNTFGGNNCSGNGKGGSKPDGLCSG